MNYLIIDYIEKDKVDYDQIREISFDFCRRTINNNRFMVSYENSVPNFINNLSNYEGPYDYSSMFDILQTEQWKSVDFDWGL